MNKNIEAITDIDKDFAQWYTDVVKKAELIDYSSVRGCIIFRPYGYKIWELIKSYLDKKFKETGHENVYMPLFIPESLITKEKEHITESRSFGVVLLDGTTRREKEMNR